MLSRLSAAYALIRDIVLNKRNTTGFNSACYLLELVLTFRLSAPHSLNKAGMILRDIKEFIVIVSYACLFLKIAKRSCIKLLMYRCEHLFNFLYDII